MNLEIEPLTEPLGAIVYGWNPESKLSRDDEGLIRAGLRDHQVLVFRGQTPPSDDELVGFARRFGDLVQGSEWFGDIEEKPIPEAEHSMVLRHPDSGREILYVSKGITRHIVGIPKDESDDLLGELTAESTRPEYVYAHTWKLGDLVVFDTLGTLHRRDAWNPNERRVMRQLSTLWTPPVSAAVV